MVIQLLYVKQDVVIEQFSNECRKTKTKVITLANHKGCRAIHCPIKTHEMQKNLREQVTIGFGFTCDLFWVKKVVGIF